MHGQFSWYDLMTPDVVASKKFYPSVTAWGTEEWDKADYTMWTASGAPFAGMNPITPEQRAQGVPSHWLGYVSVDSVEAAASKVTSLGGKVMHGPEDIPDVGRFAIIQDPQGAMLAIFKSASPSPGYDGTHALGRFTWHELMTTDYNAAFNFYRQLFGWEKTSEMDMGPAGKYLMYGLKGRPFGGIYNREGAPPSHANMPPSWLYYANVKDVNKAVESAKKAGGKILVGPMEVPDGSWVAVGMDTLGAAFAVHQSAPVSGKTTKSATRSTPKAKQKPASASRSKARRPKAKVRTTTKARSKTRPKTKARPKKRVAAKRKPAKKAKRRR